MDDRLADRISAKELAGNYYRLDIQHCRYVFFSWIGTWGHFYILFTNKTDFSETDTGMYTAKAANGSDSSTCSAQLIVHESKLNFSMLFFVLISNKE